MVGKKSLRYLVCLIVFCPVAVVAEKAPVFKLPTDKSSINLSSYRGKLVYVDFWASWCDPCRKSFPWMTELQKRYKKNLKVIAINLDEEREQAHKFLQKNRPGFTIAYDPAGKVAEAYKVQGMPSSYLIDRRGQIASTHIGFRSKNKEAIEAEIKSHISKM